MSALVLRWCALDQSALSRVAVIVGPKGLDGDFTADAQAVYAARDAALASADSASISETVAALSADAAAEARDAASGYEASALLAAQAAANAYTGPLASGEWKKFRAWPRMLMTGVGSVAIDARNALGAVAQGVASFTLTGGDIIEYPFFGADAIEVRATLTGTATAEIF